MKFRIKTTEFEATVSKMGGQRIINVPAAVQGIEPGDKVKVKKVKR